MGRKEGSKEGKKEGKQAWQHDRTNEPDKASDVVAFARSVCFSM